jgi:hypothetical protein
LIAICKNIKCCTQSKSENGVYIFFWLKCRHQLCETQFMPICMRSLQCPPWGTIQEMTVFDGLAIMIGLGGDI